MPSPKSKPGAIRRLGATQQGLQLDERAAIDDPIHTRAAARIRGCRASFRKKGDDVAWIADGLRAWVWPQERYPEAARRFASGLGLFADLARVRWTRARLVKAFDKTLPVATKAMTDLIGDHTIFLFLAADSSAPGFGYAEQIDLIKSLTELRRRSIQVSRLRGLVSADGKARAGRSKALAPGQFDEKVACARSVMIAWKFVRREFPGPYVEEATRAADLLFALGVAPAGRFELVKKRAGWGVDPAKAWPRYFKAALKPNPILDVGDEQILSCVNSARRRPRSRFQDRVKSRPARPNLLR